MRGISIVLGCLSALCAGAASAELTKVSKQSEFVRLVSGKTLSRPMVRLIVTDDGNISGKGLKWNVTGHWTWRDGYFCREISWGGDDMGYNCQEVRAKGGRIRFTLDRGKGESAEFRLK